MKKILKSIKPYLNIKQLRKIIKTSFTNFTFLWFFVISSVINSTLLRVLTLNNIFNLIPFFVDLGIVLLIASFSFLIKNKKNLLYFLMWSIILTAICVINSIYFTYYQSFVSVSLLATSIFIKDVGDAVVENVFKFKDIIYLWQPIFLILVYRNLYRKKRFIKSENTKGDFRKHFILPAIILIIISFLISPTNWGRLFTLWNRESVTMTFGIYIYQFNDLIQSLQPKLNNLFGYDKALKIVSEYYEENQYKDRNNKYTNVFKGKNIIFIHAESIQTYTMGLTFNDNELTPNLNKLAAEGINFSKFYSQVGVGTSSDAEFTLNTSLLASSSGTVFVNYFDREYITIPKLLKEKGYYIFSMHANNGDFWNRTAMHKNMGYDILYDKSYYVIDETIGLGLSDKSFFRQSVPIMKSISESQSPFMATMIMLTNHTPFSDLELMDEYPMTWNVNIEGREIVRDYLEKTKLGNYFRSVHYADQAIGQFISDLDAEGLLDNTVIVIYGDHDARLDQKYYDILYNYDPYTDTILTELDEGYIKQNEYTYELNRSVPFIIWSKDQQFGVKVTTPMGMVDILPTLGNMLGFHSDYQLGEDIFNVQDNTVVFANGSYLTSKIYYNSQKGEIYSIDGDAVDENYVKERNDYANNLIKVSNYIINYDLIKKIKEKEKTLNG